MTIGNNFSYQQIESHTRKTNQSGHTKNELKKMMCGTKRAFAYMFHLNFSILFRRHIFLTKRSLCIIDAMNVSFRLMWPLFTKKKLDKKNSCDKRQKRISIWVQQLLIFMSILMFCSSTRIYSVDCTKQYNFLLFGNIFSLVHSINHIHQFPITLIKMNPK